MQTVNFQCGHCNNLMAVTPNLLGQQVRCPHCQQVVLAPSPSAAPPPPEPAPVPRKPEPAEDYDSIFDQPHQDDLFGGHGRAPVLEVPRESAPQLEIEPTQPTVVHGSGRSQRHAPAPATSTLSAPPENPFDESGSPQPPTVTADGLAQDGESAGSGVALGDETEAASTPSVVRKPVVRSDRGMILFLLSGLIILVPYAVFATAIAVYFYFRWQTAPNPMEVLPDVENQYRDMKRQGKQGSFTYPRYPADSPLPDRLRAPMNKPIRIGDIELTATKVEQAMIVYCYRHNDSKDPETKNESLLLHLRVRNVSSDLAFRPMDPAFVRKWKETQPRQGMPYTFLDMGGKKRFYGGPVEWNRRTRFSDDIRIYVDGQQEHERELKPGETMKTVICTDPDDKVASHLRSYEGKLLWRVQVRRGLVRYGDEEYPATAVVGFEFAKSEITK